MTGVAIVGDCDKPCGTGARGLYRLRQSKIQHLHGAVWTHFDIGWLQVAVNDALFVRRLEGFRDLFRDCKCLVDRNRAIGNAIGQSRSLNQLRPTPENRRPFPSRG
jgi:hypothetical protein